MPYYKKFDLEDIFKCEALKDVLPAISENNQFKTTEKTLKNGTIRKSYKNPIALNNIPNQIGQGILMHTWFIENLDVIVLNQEHSKINIEINSVTDVDKAQEKIVSVINAMRSTLKYVNTFKTELSSALKYTYTCKLNGKDTPKVALRIKDLNEIKSMSWIQKRNLVYNIIESVLFDSDFSNVQSWNKLKGKNGSARYGVPKSYDSKYRLWKTLKREYDERKIYETK